MGSYVRERMIRIRIRIRIRVRVRWAGGGRPIRDWTRDAAGGGLADG